MLASETTRARRLDPVSSKRRNRVWIPILLAAAALVVASPFYWMITTAFKTPAEALALPPTLFPEEPTLQAFREAFDVAPFARFMLNSLIYAVGTALTLVVTSVTAGYAFARIAFPGRDIVFILLLGTMILPQEVTVIPNFLIIQDLGFHNTFAGLIAPNAAHAFSIFLVREAVKTLPTSLFDAGSLDGLSEVGILRYIAFPLIKPTVAVVAFLGFMRAWNDLLWPIIATNTEEMRTVQVGLLSISQQVSEIPILMAAASLIVFPVVIVFLVMQRQVIESIALSGIK